VSDTPLSPPPRFAWDWAGWWTLVFVGNLPLPLLFGWGVVGSGGLFGLFGALAVMFWVGFALCLFRYWVGRSLVAGGAVVAVTQGVPILHIACGLFGEWVWLRMGGRPLMLADTPQGFGGWRGDPNVAALVVVFCTAHPLLVCTVLMGAVVRWFRGDRPIWFTRKPDPDADAS
jgi:hypothetical protein